MSTFTACGRRKATAALMPMKRVRSRPYLPRRFLKTSFRKMSPMKVEFLDPAVQELYEAINFYNVQPNGLGQEFAEEVENAIERIRQNPEAWTVVSSSKRARRYLTNRFPYGIIYQIRPDVF